jgi:hypothetical protein
MLPEVRNPTALNDKGLGVDHGEEPGATRRCHVRAIPLGQWVTIPIDQVDRGTGQDPHSEEVLALIVEHQSNVAQLQGPPVGDGHVPPDVEMLVLDHAVQLHVTVDLFSDGAEGQRRKGQQNQG